MDKNWDLEYFLEERYSYEDLWNALVRALPADDFNNYMESIATDFDAYDDYAEYYED